MFDHHEVNHGALHVFEEGQTIRIWLPESDVDGALSHALGSAQRSKRASQTKTLESILGFGKTRRSGLIFEVKLSIEKMKSTIERCTTRCGGRRLRHHVTEKRHGPEEGKNTNLADATRIELGIPEDKMAATGLMSYQLEDFGESPSAEEADVETTRRRIDKFRTNQG